jgi:hypothetical protein
MLADYPQSWELTQRGVIHMRLISAFLVVMLFALAVPSAHATFHFMQIEQVIGGVDGDNSMQAIQLRMRASFQNLVSGARILVFDAAGSNPVVVSTLPTDVVNHGVGVRILIASANFVSRTTPPAVPDFTMDALIPASYLAAGSMTFESVVGRIVYWRLSWGGGGYTGSTLGSVTNDADGNFGPPFAGPLPSSDTRAVRFQGAASAASSSNAVDYALTAGDAVFVNNAGQSFTVETVPTGFDSPPLGAPSMRNFPNPFNPSTEIVFNMVRAGHASLVVFDARGGLVAKLLDRDLEAGPNRVVWNGRSSSGRVMATGVFFYRLVTRDAVLTRKMVLLK